jgi:hypothetical protein
VATAGDVYVGSGKHVVCLDASNGSLCWQPPFTADSRGVTAPVVGNGVDTSYVGTLDGNVYALSRAGDCSARASPGGRPGVDRVSLRAAAGLDRPNLCVTTFTKHEGWPPLPLRRPGRARIPSLDGRRWLLT